MLEHINRDKLSSREGSRLNSEFVEDTGEGQADEFRVIMQTGSDHAGGIGLQAVVWCSAILRHSLQRVGLILKVQACSDPAPGIERRFRSKLDDYRGSG